MLEKEVEGSKKPGISIDFVDTPGFLLWYECSYRTFSEKLVLSIGLRLSAGSIYIETSVYPIDT